VIQNRIWRTYRLTAIDEEGRDRLIYAAVALDQQVRPVLKYAVAMCARRAAQLLEIVLSRDAAVFDTTLATRLV
jgi:hypothetical protein